MFAKFILAALACLMLMSATDDPRLKYIEKYSKIAVSEMKRTGVPASITLAQGILESDSGRSMLSVDGNNHFGVKCHKDWKGRKIHKDAEIKDECFRAYPTAEASFKDHSDFLKYQDRYQFLFDLDRTDYKGWAHGLKKAGYATDPAYPQKLIKLIEEYKLFNYDKRMPVEVVKVEERVNSGTVYKDEGVYREEITFPVTREIFYKNGTPYIYAMEGETIASIAERYNLFVKELIKFNNFPAYPRPFKAGDIVYLK